MDYVQFVSKVKTLTNIDLSFYKEKQMKRRINALITRNGKENYQQYFELLKSSKEHLDEFMQFITINVSEFFRNPPQWEILNSDILPRLLNSKSHLKIWSSACATGEEPYSLAILCNELGIFEKVNIIASDIDINALEKAKEGKYEQKGISNIPKEIVNRYFVKYQNCYIIRQELKNKIKYIKLDLLRDNFPMNFDLILCRNVMIYFTEEAKDILYRKFHKALAPDGIFFVGSTEQIIMPQKYGFANLRNFFYKKI